MAWTERSPVFTSLATSDTSAEACLLLTSRLASNRGAAPFKSWVLRHFKLRRALWIIWALTALQMTRFDHFICLFWRMNCCHLTRNNLIRKPPGIETHVLIAMSGYIDCMSWTWSIRMTGRTDGGGKLQFFAASTWHRSSIGKLQLPRRLKVWN